MGDNSCKLKKWRSPDKIFVYCPELTWTLKSILEKIYSESVIFGIWEFDNPGQWLFAMKGFHNKGILKKLDIFAIKSDQN